MIGIPETVKVYNPLTSDFSYPWLDDNNSEHILTLPSMQITKLPKYQADFMVKHLIDYMMIDGGYNLADSNQREQLRKEIVK